MSDIKVCVYDNPRTMCREAWQDGKVVAHISAGLLMLDGFQGDRRMFFGLNAGEHFVTGCVYGDPEAIAIEQRPAPVVMGIDPAQPGADATVIQQVAMPTVGDGVLLKKIEDAVIAGHYVFITPQHAVMVGDFNYITRQVLNLAGLETLLNTIMGAAEANEYIVMTPDKTIYLGTTMAEAYEAAKDAQPVILAKAH